MAIKYNIPEIANEVFENIKKDIKTYQIRDEAIEKQERQKEELTKQSQEQNLQQKLKELQERYDRERTQMESDHESQRKEMNKLFES